MKWLKKFAHLGLRLWMAVYHGFRAKGRERIRLDEPTLIVANHASHIDIAAICAALPLDEIPRLRVAAARDHIFTKPWPAVCLVRFLFNAFPFERQNGSGSSLDRCVEHLRRGRHVVIFPEGRRSRDGRFLGLTPGFASVAYKSGAPVLPMRIHGAERALRKGTILPLPCKMKLEAHALLGADVTVPWEDRRRAYAELIREAEKALAS